MCREPKSKHALIQKRSEIKYKKNKFFLTESKERHLNLKRTEITLLYERGCSLLNAPLFRLKFFTILKSRFERKSQTLAQRVGR